MAFPENPISGSIYTVAGTAYIWDGEKWTTTPTTGANFGIGATGPQATLSREFSASEDINAGDACVLKTDGTVAPVAEVNSLEPNVILSKTGGTDFRTDSVMCEYVDGGTKSHWIFFSNFNQGRGQALQAELENGELTYTRSNVYSSSGSVTNRDTCYDSFIQKAVLVYTRSNVGYVNSFDANGNSTSHGQFGSNVGSASCAYSRPSNRVVIAYQDRNDNSLNAILLDVFGNQYGSTAQIAPLGTDVKIVYDENADRFILVYRNNTSGGSLEARSLNIEPDNSMTVSSPTPLYNTGSSLSLSFDEGNSKALATWTSFDQAPITPSGLFAKAATIEVDSSGVITTSTPVNWTTSIGPTYTKGVYDSVNQVMVLTYRISDSDGQLARATTFDLSGPDIAFGPIVNITAAPTTFVFSSYDIREGQVLVSYRDEANNRYLGNTVIEGITVSSNFDDGGYIGFAEEAISDGLSGRITMMGGINEQQSGLTPGRAYYIARNGDLDTAPSEGSILGGTSISATEILVR